MLSRMSQTEPHEPYVSSSTNLAEITLKSILLGAFLAVVLGAANMYLGLFAGLTVSASVPAAVISMAILRAFRNSNILENNIVQTAASAGESVAAGVIFTIPALVILGVWTEFDYWETTMIAGFGGILGVLFSIPLRRALIVQNPLKFPEGVATAEVLKVGESRGAGIRHIATAGAIGAVFKLGETGLRLWGGVMEQATYAGGTILYFGSNLSPALVAVGYIVGLNIAVLVFLGGALNWLIAIPIVAMMEGIDPATPAAEAAGIIWSTQTRYIGVGAMVIGGLWALVRLRRSLIDGIRSGAAVYRQSRAGASARIRTDRDIPIQWIGGAIVVAVVPLYLIFEYITGRPLISAVMAVIMLVAGFLFSAVAAYMSGLVGSSNNPISGVTIATILSSALLLRLMLGADDLLGPASAILIGAVVCCAAAMSGDNLQDLKTGYLVGATPYKQQIMQAVGVIAAAVVAAPTLTLLLTAYGIGAPTETHPNPLTAPQATLMASVARGVFEGGLPIAMVAVGMSIAVGVIVLDLYLESRGSSFRTPVLALAVGIYLPFELSVPIAIGGLIAWFAARVRPVKAQDHGVLFAAGLITGEALIGIGMAIPIVIYGRPDVLAFWGVHEGNLPGIVLLAAVAFMLYRSGISKGEAAVR